MNPQDINSRSEPQQGYPPGNPRVNDVTVPAQNYASNVLDSNRLESLEEPLEVHAVAPQVSGNPIPKRFLSGAFFSRRRAMIISTVITLAVLTLTVAAMAFLVRRTPSDIQNDSKISEQRDVKIEGALDSTIPKGLQGTQQSLLVNGDIVTRGSLRISNGGFATIIRVVDPTEDQTLTLPNGSGTICIDTNNCNYAALDDLTAAQNQLSTLQGNVDDINTVLSNLEERTPSAGVDTLNGQRGAVSIQGSLNRVSVSTSNGVITLSAPQDLDSNANVQFGSLTVTPTGQIAANTLIQTGAGNSININAGNDMITFTAGGRVFQLPNSGPPGGTQTICTTGASCAAGGGTAVLLADGTAQTDNSANVSIHINDLAGGNLLQLTTGAVPVNRLVVANNGDTTVGGSLTVTGLGSGVVKATAGALSVGTVSLTTEISGTLAVNNGGIGLNTIPTNGVLIGNGTSPVNTVTAGGAGLCLMSNAGAPSFQACPGGSSSFTVAGTSGTPQTIASGDTLTIAAGNNVTTTAGATDTVTLGTVNNPNFTTSVTTPLLQSSGALSITPGGAFTAGATSQTTVLQGSSTTITSNGAGNDIVLTTADQIRLSGFNCAALGNGGKLTTDASGNLSCAADNGGSGSAITGTGNVNRIALFTGAQTVADSWLLQNGSTLEVDSTRNLSLLGGNFSVVGTGLFSGLITANGGLTIEAGDTFTFNGDAFTDLTGTGLTLSSGSLQTTLGTSVDLTSEVNGILPVANGGTGLNSGGAANGQLLVGNGTGFTLATVTQGTGITITNGAGSITVASTLGVAIDSAEITDLTITNADIANSTINLSTKTTGNYVATVADSGSGVISVSGSGSNNAAVTLGLVADSIGDTQLAFNIGQNLTTASSPSFAGATVTGGTFTVGTTSQLASLVLHDGNGQTTTLRPGDSTGNLTFTLPTADGTSNQCIKTNASGALSFGDCVASVGGGGITGSGTQNRLSKFGAGGTSIGDSTITDNGTSVTTSVDLIVQGGDLTVGTALQNAALTLYGNGFAANVTTATLTNTRNYTLPDGSGDFCIKQLGNCSGSGGGNAPNDAQYLTLALDAGLSAERTLSFNGTNFSVLDNGANGNYTVNTAQNINTTAAPSFAGLSLTGNLQLNANTLQGGAAVIDFTNFDVASTGNLTAGTYNGQTISSAASLTGTLAVAGLTTLNGGLTVDPGDTFTFNGDAFTDLTGNGLQVSTNALTILTQASKGLEVDGNGLSLIDCASGEVLKYNGSNQWACATDAGSGGIGDDVSVNGVAATGANFINTTASGTVASVTWALNNVSNPDDISLTIGVASNTEAGVVTTGAQTFAGNKTFNGSVVLAASQSITITGGNTASRPGSPTEGMLYYDTDTDQLLTYNGTKWQADAHEAILVAASDSSPAAKAAADYVADGTADQAEITSAITEATTITGSNLGSRKIYLFAGTYSIADTISLPNNTILSGAGNSTLLQFANLGGVSKNMITNTTTGGTGTGVIVRDLRLDGNKATNSTDTFTGIYLDGIGSSSTNLAGATITNVTIQNFENNGIHLANVANNIITGNTIQSNDDHGIYSNNGNHEIITNNIITNNTLNGIYVTSTVRSILSNNTLISNANAGLRIDTGSNNIISNNIFRTNAASGTNSSIFMFNTDSNNVTANNITDTAGTGYAIDISDAGSDSNYLSNNTFSGMGATTLNDIGTGTVFANQIKDSSNGNLYIQPAGTVELMKNTNVTGTLNITSSVDTNGSLTVGNADQFVINNTGIVTSGTWNATAIVDAYVADVLTISSSGNVDWQALSNYPAACSAGQAITQLGDSVTCTTFAAGSGSGNYIQNQSASQQTTSTFWISGTGRTDTSFTTPLLDTPTATALNIGTTNATQINLNKNVVIAASQSLTITGGNTASRPGSPTEGMVYYDTTTKQLLVYANGKWQADRTESVIVAASNSSQSDKDAADYVADGNTGAAADGDQVQINAALTAASGKKVVLLAGTYVADGTILIPNNTTLAGVGKGTLIELADLDVTDNLIEATGSSRTGQDLRDMRLDGRSDLNTAGTQFGVSFSSVGGSSPFRVGSTISNVHVTRFRTYDFALSGVVNTTLINNTAQSAGNYGVFVSGSNNTFIGNTITGNTSHGFYILGSSNTFTNNNVYSNAGSGFLLDGSSSNTFTNNNVQNNTAPGFNITNLSDNNIVSNNRIQDNGGSTTNNGVYLDDSDSNTITGNAISDGTGTTNCSTTCYAINISASTADTTYLADNTLGNGTINDAGTGTVYGGQVNGSGNYVVQPAGTVELMKNTNVTGTLNITSNVDTNGSLTVGNANQFVISNTGVITSGTWNGAAVAGAYGGTGQTTTAVGDLLLGAGSNTWSKLAIGGNGTCLLSNGTTAAWNSCTATDLPGAYAATAITSGAAQVTLADAKGLRFIAADTSTDPSIIMKLECTGCATGTTGNFLVQNASSSALLSVAGNGTIEIGTANNGISLSGSGGTTSGTFTLKGTARNSKKIRLLAEYPSVVLTPDGSNNLGTMTSGYDNTASARMNYYNWTTTQVTNQDYDIVVQVPLPSDFDGWDGSNPLSITGYTTNTTNGTITLEARDSADTQICNFVNVTPGSTSTWTANTAACTLSTGTYTAGDYITLRIRLQAPTSGNTRVGNITLSYKSKF